jgi:elongator complex protein 3
MVNLTIGIKSMVPKYVRISRVLRDIPSKFIVAGLKDSLRDIVRERMRQADIECRCIRCREYGHRVQAGREAGEPHMVRMDYDASGGREVFLSFEDEGETLYGLLRMRLQSRPVPALGPGWNGNLALIRELHVFGPEVPINEQRTESVQHRGLGKALLREAERIARDDFLANRVIVLSGTGAREYYRTEFGYSSQGDYMIKNLSPHLAHA